MRAITSKDFAIDEEMFSVIEVIVLHELRSLIAVHVFPNFEISAVLHHQRSELFLRSFRVGRLVRERFQRVFGGA